MTYRIRDTGELVSAATLRNRERRNGKAVPPEHKWTTDTTDRLGVDPVVDVDDEVYSRDTHVATHQVTTQNEETGVWERRWVIGPRFATRADAEAHVLEALDTVFISKRDGGVTVGGLRVKTDAGGIAISGLAVAAQLPEYDFVVGDQVHKLSFAQVTAVRQAVAAHVQACYSRKAALIGHIKGAANPLSIDVSQGWPGE